MTAGVQSFGKGNVIGMVKALVDAGVFIIPIDFNPVDGTSGSFAGFAGTGTFLINFTTGAVYGNTGTKDDPVWSQFEQDPAVIPLTQGNILVGDGSNEAQGVAMTGDVAIDDSGVTQVDSIQNQIVKGDEVAPGPPNNAVGAVPIVHRIDVTGPGNHDLTLTYDTRIIDVWTFVQATGIANSTAQLFNNDSVTGITTVMNLDHNVGFLVRPQQIFTGVGDVAAGDFMRVVAVQAGVMATVYIQALRLP